MKEQIKNHKNFKKLLENINDLKNEYYISANDLHGVDFEYQVSPKDFDLDIEDIEKFAEILENILSKDFEYCHIHTRYLSDLKEVYLSVSTTDDIFLEGNTIYYPEAGETDIFADDLEAFCLIEEWCSEKGIYPYIWSSIGYTIDRANFTKEYYNIDKETRLILLEIFRLRRYLDSYTAYTSDYIDKGMFANKVSLGKAGKILEQDNIEILDIDGYLDKMTLEVLIPEEAFNNNYISKKEFEKLTNIEAIGTTNSYDETSYTLSFSLKANTLSFLESLHEEALNLMEA